MTRESQNLTLRIEFLSDWHIGSGLEQPGGVDHLVQRDTDGLPFVPAKTLTGVLRDAAEQAAAALDRADRGRWHEWVLWLFGDQPNRNEIRDTTVVSPAALSVRPGRFSDRLRDVLGDDQSLDELQQRHRRELRGALFFEKPGVKIAENGGAADGCLRLSEMVRGGVTLYSEITLQVDRLGEGQRTVAVSLLSLAVAIVERLGGKRRRGAGRVCMTLTGPAAISKLDLADWLESSEAAEVPEPPNEMSADIARHPDSSQLGEATGAGDVSGWQVVPFRLQLQTPLMVTERTTGNVLRSLDFVPGTLLLPIVTRALRGSFPAVRAAIAQGDIRVSPATLEIDGQRGLPVPAALFHAKGADRFDQRAAVRNAFREPAVGPLEHHVKDFRTGYILEQSTGRLPRFGKTHRVVRPHNTVDEERQRPTGDVGGVFACEAISAGTVLRGEIRIRQSIANGLQDSRWWERIAGAQSLGRSRKDDYGQVTVSVDEPYPLQAEIATDESSVIVWLTSDALLRDGFGRTAPTAEDLSRAVAHTMQVSPEGVSVVTDECGSHAFLRHRRLESWHVGWGLPRPSLVSLAAGSCVELEFTTPPTAEQLRRLAEEGIGLRKAEGYGTVRVRSELLSGRISSWTAAGQVNQSANAADEIATAQVISRSEPEFQLARQLEAECWKRKILQTAIDVTTTPEKRAQSLNFSEGSSKPNPAQAALLRNLLQSGLGDSTILERLNRLEEMRGTKWPGNALPHIRRFFSGESTIWQVLARSEAGEGDEDGQLLNWPVLTEQAQEHLMGPAAAGGLRDLAIHTLIDAGLRAHQRDRERERQLQDGEQDSWQDRSAVAST